MGRMTLGEPDRNADVCDMIALELCSELKIDTFYIEPWSNGCEQKQFESKAPVD